jgi:uncharacterized membrane protein YtjA (UPF0391 family)
LPHAPGTAANDLLFTAIEKAGPRGNPCLGWPVNLLEDRMLYWALVFFIIAIVAAVFGFGGIAAAAAGIAKVLFAIFIIIFLITLVLGLSRRSSPPL